MSVRRVISSPSNLEFKRLKGLSKRAREVKRQGLALLEGIHLVECCINAGVAIDQVVLTLRSSRNNEVAALVGRIGNNVSVLIVSDALFSELTDISPDVGIAAVIEVPQLPPLLDPMMQDAIVLDRIQDAGNLGTIFRTAAAVGISRAILGVGCARAWGGKVLRAGQGAHFSLSIQEDVDLLEWADKQQIPLVGALPDTPVSIFEADLREPRLWIFGSEGQGITKELQAKLDIKLFIPMASEIESLNVGAAAAVFLYEAYRQRRYR